MLSALSHPQSETVYRSTLDHSLQRQLRQLLLSIFNLISTFLLWHTPYDHVTISAHTIRLIEIDTWRVINSCTYLLTYLNGCLYDLQLFQVPSEHVHVDEDVVVRLEDKASPSAVRRDPTQRGDLSGSNLCRTV